ncbi:MAG: LTA synthase family protein [Thalassotalea sp.]
MITALINILRPFVLFSLLLITSLFITRLGFMLWQSDRLHDVNTIITLLFNGLRIDLSTIGYCLILPAIFHPWLLYSKFHNSWLNRLNLVFILIFMGVLFFELATPAFINEYGLRPNRLFIEYLTYPNEVIKMLVNGHLLTLIIVTTALTLIFVFIKKLSQYIIKQGHSTRGIPPTARVTSFFILFVALFLCARGTLGHRPINPALVYFSTDPLINSLTLNSIYSVSYAYKQMGNEKNSAKIYGKMPKEKIISIVQQQSKIPLRSFNTPHKPSLSTRLPTYQGPTKNLVIILEESLGAQFVSSLGGLNLSPEIDKLSNEGWAFKRLFATGTRSVRGIEAVITGFPPTPARAVVKLDKSQQNFFTIASLLKANNYKTQFIYGGESHFDNMKSFFLGNGFDHIVDFKDIKKPNFVGSWGASDEDLFTQANVELTQLHKANQPFFSFIFSSSNHDPFEIPENIVTPIAYTSAQLALYDDKELSRHKAIQYADYALGKFIAKAKQQPYWQDTLFLIVADHDARALGQNLVPINNFHIPGIILNSGMEPQIDLRIVSQIDLAPTLLSLMGVENKSPMLGHDLTANNSGGRAIMQYADNFAYMKNNKVVILQPQKAPLSFNFDVNKKALSKATPIKELEDIALAHALWGSLAYEKEWHTLLN